MDVTVKRDGFEKDPVEKAQDVVGEAERGRHKILGRGEGRFVNRPYNYFCPNRRSIAALTASCSADFAVEITVPLDFSPSVFTSRERFSLRSTWRSCASNCARSLSPSIGVPSALAA